MPSVPGVVAVTGVVAVAVFGVPGRRSIWLVLAVIDVRHAAIVYPLGV